MKHLQKATNLPLSNPGSGRAGLVLSGGYSKRLGMEKGHLQFHDKPQYLYLLKWLNRWCGGVYLSCRAEQADDFPDCDNFLMDTYEPSGPMGALVTAFETLSVEECIAVPVDLPLLRSKSIEKLLEASAEYKNADAILFRSRESNRPEPLCGLWRRTALPTLKNALLNNNLALYKTLLVLDIRDVEIDEQQLINVNTPDVMQLVLTQLAERSNP